MGCKLPLCCNLRSLGCCTQGRQRPQVWGASKRLLSRHSFVWHVLACPIKDVSMKAQSFEAKADGH